MDRCPSSEHAGNLMSVCLLQNIRLKMLCCNAAMYTAQQARFDVHRSTKCIALGDQQVEA